MQERHCSTAEWSKTNESFVCLSTSTCREFPIETKQDNITAKVTSGSGFSKKLSTNGWADSILFFFYI